MRTDTKRRSFIKTLGAASIVGIPNLALGTSKKVVIIGGGTGGATAAKYLRIADPSIEVTLIEPKKIFHTCYFSNLVLSGDRSINSIAHKYDGLRKRGVIVVHDWVSSIDYKNQKVVTKSGNKFSFDRCIVSPGIEFKWDAVEGYSKADSKEVPHAWQAGEQTVLLRKQLEAMDDGGTVIISPPPTPYRCPAAPYERASLIAKYLKKEKPKSKLLIFDSNSVFTKMELFIQGWGNFYGYGTDNALIEWHSSVEEASVVEVDVANKTITTAFDDTIEADVLNFIPAQKAGIIAQNAGLTNDSGWCPVALDTFESTLHKNIHIIGDAGIATGMPKSGYATYTQGQVCAAAVASLLNGHEIGSPSYASACYSIIAEDWGVSLVTIYKLAEDGHKIMKVSGGTTPMGASAEHHRREVENAYSWYNNLTNDIFGS